MKPPPRRIQTDRLLLRAYEPDDAAAFAALLEKNRDHYAAFIPFFLEDDPRERVERFVRVFDDDESYPYAAFRGDRLIGGGGLLPRVGPGGIEIGYHLSRECVGNGYATEIAAALIRTAFEVCGVDRVELHIEPENTASIAVADRLGIPFEATLRRRVHHEGREPRDLAIYTLFRSAYDDRGGQLGERP